jgi:hypothetical protein
MNDGKMIEYLREKALRLREFASRMQPHQSAKLNELANEFELKADELDAASRTRTLC